MTHLSSRIYVFAGVDLLACRYNYWLCIFDIFIVLADTYMYSVASKNLCTLHFILGFQGSSVAEFIFQVFLSG